MKEHNHSDRRPAILHPALIVLGALMLGLSLAVIGITGYFRLSWDAAALRDSAMTSVQGTWHKKIALRVGSITTGLVRAGSHFFKLPPEARAALASLHGAEVGLYRIEASENEAVDHRAILARADQAMSARSWDRVVGVSRENELMAVYVPRRGLSMDRARCCVLVLQNSELIIAGGKANLNPLLEIAAQHIDFKKAGKEFAFR